MSDKFEKLKRRAERDNARALEYARKAKKAEKALQELERNADTRRKILVGSWMLDKANRMPELGASLLRELNNFWLYRDDDRALFGFPVLDEAEKEKRMRALQERDAKPEMTQAPPALAVMND